MTSQAKYLWFELMKCKKICKKHDEYWHTWATNEKKETLEKLKVLEISKSIMTQLKEGKIKPKPTTKRRCLACYYGWKCKKHTKPTPYPKKKLAVKSAAWRKHRSDNERIRRANLRKTNPKWHKKNLKTQKKYYRKNPGPQIASSTKWNQEHKDRKNANNRASYDRNKDAINARRRKLRKAKKHV